MKLRNYDFRKMLIFLALISSSFNAVNADVALGYLDVTNGYRQDKISVLVEVFDRKTLAGIDEIKVKNMQLYQLGLEGKWVFCNVFLRLEGNYGWSNYGKYREFSGASGTELSKTEAKIHKGRTKDFNVGVGYLFPFSYCSPAWEGFFVGPQAGWSYDNQHFKTSHTKTDEVFDPILNDLRYSNRWQGPWVGVDAVFQVCQFDFNVGYEYHFAHWHATWKLAGPDVPAAFSDRRSSYHAHGQVVYLDGRWNWCSCWNVGLGFKLQKWKAIHGCISPLKGAGDLSTQDKVKQAKWCSFAATFDIGYTF